MGAHSRCTSTTKRPLLVSNAAWNVGGACSLSADGLRSGPASCAPSATHAETPATSRAARTASRVLRATGKLIERLQLDDRRAMIAPDPECHRIRGVVHPDAPDVRRVRKQIFGDP